MSEKIYTDVNLRHDFVLIFDVIDGNPNGDPDAGNLPRVDPETMQGMVTDVCLKRKVRDYVDSRYGTEERMKIYVEHKGVLNEQHQKAYTALKMKSSGTKQKREDVNRAREWMCENFYDVRLFGAVMTTGVNCGQVRGPVQLTFGRSVDTIVPLDLSITRVAVTRPEDAVTEEGEGKETEMGRKSLVPYGLYITRGFYNSNLGNQTKVDEKDLVVLWESLINMWERDRSAARGMMASRGLYVFSHENAYGNAPAHRLFERVQVRRKEGVKAPRSFADYEVKIDDKNLPQGITLNKLLE